MNLLAVLDTDEFKRDANAVTEQVRRDWGGTATAAPHFDFHDGEVRGWRWVITGTARTILRRGYQLPSKIAS